MFCNIIQIGGTVMVELTAEDREKITNQITEYKEQKLTATPAPGSVPITPDGQNANEALNDALHQEANPDKKETKRIKKKIKGIWRNWRTVTLDAKSLEIEKYACQIEVERAETKAKLAEIRRKNELAEAQHWLALNKGNLVDIDANTESRPHKFWYGLRRFCYHVTKLTDNIPKVFKNLFWIGAVCLGLVLLKSFNVI